MGEPELGPSEAWAAAVHAIAATFTERPLPKRLIKVDRGQWELTLNNTEEVVPIDAGELRPFEVFITSKEYLIVGIVGPAGGMLGGMPESEFIAEMNSLAAPVLPASDPRSKPPPPVARWVGEAITSAFDPEGGRLR